MNRLKAKAAVAALGTLALLCVTATSASADGNTWGYVAGTDSGVIRHAITGSGTDITSQSAKIQLTTGDMICNYYINWVYLDMNSNPWYTERAFTNTGCSSAGGTAGSGQQYTVASVYRGHGTAKKGYACAYVFTNNAYRGRACVRVGW
ncbi:hypothetical protein ABEG17_02620 [Pedococcus sp. KACC 23699]|uniref:Uncharacterized protein n=1 Tax=Pedococcus sp. KACC 23699 TaxID=3149228 RepID=A0AAU7JVU9_9MICO